MIPGGTLTLDQYLTGRPDRCAYGFSPNQHPGACECEHSDWHVFTRAIRSAMKDNGEVSQNDIRPLIRGRIDPKRIGQLYRRARSEGLLVEVRREPSADVAGRNSHHWQPVYRVKAT